MESQELNVIVEDTNTSVENIEDSAANTEEKLADIYLDYLAEQGFRPEIDSDGDISFKFEGRSYFINVYEDDREFFQLVYPCFWPIESEEERKQVVEACDYVSGHTKVAKIYTVRDNVWATIELFVSSPEEFKGVFMRALGALSRAREKFVEKMHESN